MLSSGDLYNLTSEKTIRAKRDLQSEKNEIPPFDFICLTALSLSSPHHLDIS